MLPSNILFHVEKPAAILIGAVIFFLTEPNLTCYGGSEFSCEMNKFHRKYFFDLGSVLDILNKEFPVHRVNKTKLHKGVCKARRMNSLSRLYGYPKSMLLNIFHRKYTLTYKFLVM